MTATDKVCLFLQGLIVGREGHLTWKRRDKDFLSDFGPATVVARSHKITPVVVVGWLVGSYQYFSKTALTIS